MARVPFAPDPIVAPGRDESSTVPPPIGADLFANLSLWAALLGLLVVMADMVVPPQHLPWTPLRLADPVGRATWAKLAAIETDAERCRAVLGEGAVRVRDQPDVDAGGFCALRGVLTIRGGTTPLRPAGPVLTCPVALSFALWERQVLQPAARAILGSEVTAIDHYGSYSCRRIYGDATGRPSQHATANALDVAGFRLRDGRRITVAADWSDPGPDGRFLRAARDGACRTYQTVLGPEYNAAHRDHLHLDRGPYRICR